MLLAQSTTSVSPAAVSNIRSRTAVSDRSKQLQLEGGAGIDNDWKGSAIEADIRRYMSKASVALTASGISFGALMAMF